MTNTAITHFEVNHSVEEIIEFSIGEEIVCKFGNNLGKERARYEFVKIIGKQDRFGPVYLIENKDGVGIATQNPEHGRLHCTNFVPFSMRSRNESIYNYGFKEILKAA